MGKPLKSHHLRPRLRPQIYMNSAEMPPEFVLKLSPTKTSIDLSKHPETFLFWETETATGKYRQSGFNKDLQQKT